MNDAMRCKASLLLRSVYWYSRYFFFKFMETFLEYIYQFYFVPCHCDVHGVCESKKVHPLPRKPLGRIVHGLCFAPDNVFSTRCINWPLYSTFTISVCIWSTTFYPFLVWITAIYPFVGHINRLLSECWVICFNSLHQIRLVNHRSYSLHAYLRSPRTRKVLLWNSLSQGPLAAMHKSTFQSPKILNWNNERRPIKVN